MESIKTYLGPEQQPPYPDRVPFVRVTERTTGVISIKTMRMREFEEVDQRSKNQQVTQTQCNQGNDY
jgi:hypothetical protein